MTYLPFLFSTLIWYYMAVFYRITLTEDLKFYIVPLTPWIMAFADNIYIKACWNYSANWSKEMLSMLFRMQSYSIEATKIAAFLSFKGFQDGFIVMCALYIIAELYVNYD